MIKFTLHDIFGYLFPGLVLLVATAIQSWETVASLPWTSVLRDRISAVVLCLLLAVLAYICGHVSVALGEWIVRVLSFTRLLDCFRRVDWVSSKDGWGRSKRVKRLQRVAFQQTLKECHMRLEIDPSRSRKFDEELTRRACYAYISKHGSEAQDGFRGVMLRRMDFYRGMMASGLVLAIVVWVKWSLLPVSALIFLSVALFIMRYVHFLNVGHIRLTLDFLLLQKGGTQPDAIPRKDDEAGR